MTSARVPLRIDWRNDLGGRAYPSCELVQRSPQQIPQISSFAVARAWSRRIDASKSAVMKRLESAATSCGLFFATQRVTATGESPAHADAAAASAASKFRANTKIKAALVNLLGLSRQLFHDIVIAPIVHCAWCGSKVDSAFADRLANPLVGYLNSNCALAKINRNVGSPIDFVGIAVIDVAWRAYATQCPFPTELPLNFLGSSAT